MVRCDPKRTLTAAFRAVKDPTVLRPPGAPRDSRIDRSAGSAGPSGRLAPPAISRDPPGGPDARSMGEGAGEAGSEAAVPEGHRGGRARVGAGRARLPAVQRAAGREGR